MYFLSLCMLKTTTRQLILNVFITILDVYTHFNTYVLKYYRNYYHGGRNRLLENINVPHIKMQYPLMNYKMPEVC